MNTVSPTKVFEPVVANEPLTLSIVFNLFTKLPVEILAVYELKEDVVTYILSLSLYVLINPNDSICVEELTKFKGNITFWTLPLNVYLPSNEDVNCDEPLIVPFGIEDAVYDAVKFSNEFKRTSSNVFILPLTASASTSNSILYDTPLSIPKRVVSNDALVRAVNCDILFPIL